MSIEQLPTSESLNVAVHDVIIPHEFIVRDTTQEDSVSCGIAVNHTDLDERRAIVTDRYIRAGYITRDDLSSGVYYDHYEDVSVPFVAKIGNLPVASLRIIPNLHGLGLPINNEPEIKVFPDWQETATQVPFEISQLAKDTKLFRDPRPTLGLIRSYFAYSRLLNENEAVAVVDNRVKELMNGPYMSFGLKEIGPSVDYLGSQSTPVFFNIDKSIQNAADAGHTDLAEFLDTGKANGYEWYTGM